jgi:hypothetical protein
VFVLKEKKNVVWISEELKDKGKSDENLAQKEDTDSHLECSEKPVENIDSMFSQHMSQYIGQTITVYTTSGGVAGCGLTGVLSQCTASHITLITHIGPPPEKPKSKACRSCPYYKSCLEAAEKLREVGSVAEIPLHSLVIFVHNSL